MLATNIVQTPTAMSMNLGTEMLVLCVPWFLAPGFTHGVPQVFHRNITLATKQIKSAKTRKIWRTVGTLLGMQLGTANRDLKPKMTSRRPDGGPPPGWEPGLAPVSTVAGRALKLQGRHACEEKWGALGVGLSF